MQLSCYLTVLQVVQLISVSANQICFQLQSHISKKEACLMLKKREAQNLLSKSCGTCSRQEIAKVAD